MRIYCRCGARLSDDLYPISRKRLPNYDPMEPHISTGAFAVLPSTKGTIRMRDFYFSPFDKSHINYRHPQRYLVALASLPGVHATDVKGVLPSKHLACRQCDSVVGEVSYLAAPHSAEITASQVNRVYT